MTNHSFKKGTLKEQVNPSQVLFPTRTMVRWSQVSAGGVDLSAPNNGKLWLFIRGVSRVFEVGGEREEEAEQPVREERKSKMITGIFRTFFSRKICHVP